MSEPFDLVILGGGCAGLSLTMALAARGLACPSVLILEARHTYANDRTWCCWSKLATPTAYPVRHQWQTMRVANAGLSLALDCGLTPYQIVAGEDFYAAALSLIDKQPNLTLRLDTTIIREPTLVNHLWHVQTSSETILARAIVDTRPTQTPRFNGATLWQSFYGQEIECDQPIFDPQVVDLMEFLPPDDRYVPFVYVLPVSPTRALIEVTVFGAMPAEPEQLSKELATAIAQRVKGAGYTTLRYENGILPMGINGTTPQLHDTYVNVGVMAGGARPSTGFAFQRIQRWANECADAIMRSGRPTAHKPDSLSLRLMDQIFLDVLRANPRRGSAIFFALFNRARTPRVIRFLSGAAGLIDGLAVVLAMPIAPFVKAAVIMIWRKVSNSATKRAA